MRQLLLPCALLAVASCKGLFIEHGNNYPCDFSEPPGTRDLVCEPGDICGADNLCQKFIYEGPRFEGAATLPVYGPGSGEGTLLHPLVLDEPITAIYGELPVTPVSRFFLTQDAGIFQERSGHVGAGVTLLSAPALSMLGMLASTQPFHFPAGSRLNVLLHSPTGRLGVAEQLPDGGASLDLVKLASSGADAVVDGVRVLEMDSPARAQPIAWTDAGVGPVQPRGLGWELALWTQTSSPVFDLAALALGPRLWVFALEEDGVEVVDTADPADAGLSFAATLDPMSATRGTLKTDQGSRIITAVREGQLPGPLAAPAEVLSTFQVNVTTEGPTLSSPWPDCRPCVDEEHIELVAPSVRNGFPTVDVVCTGVTPLPRPLRVFGSTALTQFDSCLSEEVSVPVPFSRVLDGSGRLVHWDNQWGLLIGGRRGQVWWGESLSGLEPEFLDRVPLDVAPALSGQGPAIAVIADDYLAVQQNEEAERDAGAQLNGFRRVPLNELGVPENSRLFGFVHGVGGWAVDSTGQLVRANLGKTGSGGARVEVGPRLVTASEELVRQSIGGEAFTELDGGPIGFFLAADDSLYFVPDPEEYLKRENAGAELTPDLTPEPTVPIRSLALERTPLGTDGVDRARGYLVTSRTVFQWELNGGWSSTPMALAVGEPVEVWFDTPRSALGRVGYRDGQIYSLPGGYPLVEALKDDSQVIDFENLGGWPVAYTTTGLFIAGWDVDASGKLANRFDNGVNKPMTWRPVKLPDGSEPWVRLDRREQRTKPGRLFVAVDPRTETDQLYRLLLFTDDEVRQVAHHLRFFAK